MVFADRDYCLTFAYYMNGENVGGLLVYMYTKQNDFQKQFNQRGMLGNEWHITRINLHLNQLTYVSVYVYVCLCVFYACFREREREITLYMDEHIKSWVCVINRFTSKGIWKHHLEIVTTVPLHWMIFNSCPIDAPELYQEQNRCLKSNSASAWHNLCFIFH